MKKSLAFALVGLSFVLTGCKEIIATPSDLEDRVLVDNLSEIVNNTLEKVYKDYHDSPDFKQHVLEEVLLTIAENEFTPYDELDVTKPEDLKFKNTIDARAKHLFYDEIVSGLYTYRSKFDEKKYVVEKIYGAENSYIVDANGEEVKINDLNSYPFFSEGLFLPTIDKTNFDDPSFELVHIEYYSHYIKDQFIDGIYREKLVEKYIQSEQSTTLGRNYARKVEYVAIKNNENHPTAASALINAFIDENILGSNGASDLNILANAWRGVTEDFVLNEADLLTKAKLRTGGRDHTLYGDLVADYDKINDNPNLTNISIENRFTGNGKYTKEVGLEIEKNEIRKEDFVVSDWGIRNGGFGGLPEEIRSRLLNIGVANGVDFLSDDDGDLTKAGQWMNDPENERLPSTFVRNINGEYYLVPKTYEKGNNRNFLFFEGDTFYIIKVVEAVNTAKLNSKETDESSYENFKTEEQIEEIKNEVTFRLAQLEATKTNALNHFLENVDVVFHDESIRDFFAETYPEIFGEDAED